MSPEALSEWQRGAPSIDTVTVIKINAILMLAADGQRQSIQ